MELESPANPQLENLRHGFQFNSSFVTSVADLEESSRRKVMADAALVVASAVGATLL